ncbi:S8 family serine peptidase [bacterium]|nr:S8 family serine peptidase [bacterium]
MHFKIRNLINALMPVLFAQTLLSGPAGIDPYLKKMVMTAGTDKTFRPEKMNAPACNVIIKAENPDLLKRQGFSIRSVHGLFATADVPLSMLDKLARTPGVRSVTLAQPCRFNLDVSMPEIGMPAVWNGRNGHDGHTGRNVIVGIYDTGIDCAHEDFIDSEGNTRILAIWDQTASGNPPDGFGYGTEILQNDIQAAINAGTASGLGGKDLVGHGTHVAGIAAGNGRATGNGKPPFVYIGAAPDAYLIAVKGSDNTSMPDAQILDGLNYIFKKAGEFGMPCVVNLSLGRRNGSHDGWDNFEQAVDSYLDDPGHAIVVAAGNDGQERIHVMHEFDPFIEDTLSVQINVGPNSPDRDDYLYLEGWIHALSPMAVTIVNPQGFRFGPIYPDEVFRYPAEMRPRIYVDNGSEGAQENGDKQILVQLLDAENHNELSPGLWTIKFHDASDRLHLWLTSHSLSAEIVSEVDYSTLMSEPAHARRAIAVESYISRTSWPNLWSATWGPGNIESGEISVTSSPGPSRINANYTHTNNKPEISAPGEYIVSAYSGTSLYYPGDQYICWDGVHRAYSGTSFAAPHITGLIACLFEANPDFTASQVQLILISTARSDDFTGPAWNPQWGFGKADAEAAMDRTGFENAGDHDQPLYLTPVRSYPNPFNQMTDITVQISRSEKMKVPCMLRIMNITGQSVRILRIDAVHDNELHFLWDGKDGNGFELPSGIYIGFFSSRKMTFSHKMTLMK